MSEIYTTVAKYIALFLSIISIITGALELPSEGDRYPHIEREELLLLSAYAASQDVATDGTYWYFSGKNILEKRDNELNIVKLNATAIPDSLSQLGVDHIGGISCYDGKLYCAMEDSKVWNHCTVGVYDAQTLEFIESAPLSAEHQLKGAPWLCVDGERGYIYSTQRDNAPCLVVYDLYTYEFVKTVELSEPIHKIQGGDMLGDTLYVATNNDNQSVYSANVLTGEVTLCFDRSLTYGSEGEGLTVLETADGAYIHTLDMGPLFINANFRHYSY